MSIDDKSIQRLENFILQISKLHNLSEEDPKFKQWRDSVLRFLKRTFGENSLRYSDFDCISFNSKLSPYWKGLERAEALLSGYLEDIREGSYEIESDVFSPHLNLHPKVVMASASLYSDCHYSQAIFESLKGLEQEIKKRSGIKDKIGKALAVEVFNYEYPKIKLNLGSTKEEMVEREGFMHIIMGTFLGIKNPKSHSFDDIDDPSVAVEYLAMISMLMRKIESAIP